MSLPSQGRGLELAHSAGAGQHSGMVLGSPQGSSLSFITSTE
jgi:hypothetical protein